MEQKKFSLNRGGMWYTENQESFLKIRKQLRSLKTRYAKFRVSKNQSRGQELDSKGLINTLEEIKNGGPESL